MSDEQTESDPCPFEVKGPPSSVFRAEADIYHAAARRQLRRARLFVPCQLLIILLMACFGITVTPIAVEVVLADVGDELRMHAMLVVLGGICVFAAYACRMTLGRYRYLYLIAGFLLSRAGALRIAASAEDPYAALEAIVPLFASEGVDFKPPASVLSDAAQLAKSVRK